MPVSFFGLYRGDGTAAADSLFGRRGNNPYSRYRVLKLPERGTHERTLMLGYVIALRYLGRLGVISGPADLWLESPLRATSRRRAGGDRAENGPTRSPHRHGQPTSAGC